MVPASIARRISVLYLVAVRHVQQLHDVGTVIALAAERAPDLRANHFLVVGKRQQPDGAPRRRQPVAQRLGLRLLPALIEAFKGDEQAFHDSNASMSSRVWRRRITRHSPSSTSTSAGSVWRL